MDKTMTPGEPGRSEAAVGYRLTGRFLEACDCYAICPCWIDEVPDEEQCTGLFVWDINQGDAMGHDVSGLRVASASYHEGKRRGARQRVVVLIDDRASDQQRAVLSDVFTGRQGGPLGQLADMLGELVAQRSAKIDIGWEGDKATLDIEGIIQAANEPKTGPSGRITSLVDPEMSAVYGSPALVGTSTEFHVALPELGAAIDVKGRSAQTGRFSYTG
jgi:hypothetical protein